jgi:Tfp pilus assembly protein PilO
MKLDPKYWTVIAIVLAVVVLALGVFLFVLPEKNKLGKYDEDINAAKDAKLKAETRKAQLETYEKDPEQFQRQITAIKEKIPEKVDLADIIQELDYAAEKAGLDFFSFIPEPPFLTTDNFYVVTMETQFFGRYFNMVEFFNHIERLPRSIKAVSLQVEGGDDLLPYLQITVTFRAFFTTPDQVDMLVQKADTGGTKK